MKNLKTFAIAILLSSTALFSCEKENDPKPTEDERTDRKNITTGIDLVATKNGKATDFTAFAWKIEENSEFDVNVSGINDPNYNELERGGIWDHHKKSEIKWVYTKYGSKGRDFYEPLPAGNYLVYVITQGTRQDQSGAYTRITIKPGEVLKIRKNFDKKAPYYGNW